MSRKITILHLEDEPRDAEMIRQAVIVGGIDCRILVAPDGVSFRKHLEAVTPDLVLSNLRVPGISGQEALNMIRGIDGHIPFIFVSGSLGEERAIESLRGGATDLVLKDHLSRLVPAMQSALDEAGNRRETAAATRALRESEQRLELVLNGANLGLWDWDIASGAVVFNARWAAMLGYAMDEIEPRIEAWKTRIHPDDASGVLAALDAHLDGDADSFEAEYRMGCKDGGWRWVLNRGRVVQRAPDGRPLRATGTHLDITERKQAELTNLQLETQLQQVQKMEALGTLAGGIAHDFNNILGTIIGFSELVRGDLPMNSPSRADLDEVLKAADRARQLIEQILTFSRQQPEDLKPLHLPDVVHDALQFLRATIPSTIELRMQIERGIPTILGDAAQLNQVIVNLVANAVHALTDGRGTVELSAGPAFVTTEMAGRLPNLSAGLHAVLRVADNGHGIPADLHSRIFEPFFTTKGPGTGTGLGLAVVHGIVKKHQGAIQLKSAPGAGACFEIYLPASPNLPENAPHEPGVEVLGRGLRVMLVDDEPALARVGRLMLERLGFEVDVFTDSNAAWEAFAKEPGRHRLVISDQTMPHMTGLELSNRILKLQPRLPVILTTGYHAAASREQVREAGVAGLLMKPFTFDSLKTTIAAVLGPMPA